MPSLPWIKPLAALLAGLMMLAANAAPPTPIRFGTTPVFLDNQTAFLANWKSYLERQLGQPVEFVQKSSYREVVELLLADRLEFAWLCGFPFVRHAEQMRLVSTPIYQGKPLYRSYLIVPARDQRSLSLADLRSGVFAYADPDSNSGYLVTQRDLARIKETGDRFFRRTFFTWSHANVVRAVASGLADGGAVDGYVWDALSRLHPDLTAGTRIVHRSETFGFPPIVARSTLALTEVQRMATVLQEMHRDTEGGALLRQLLLDAFGPASPEQFADIAAMAKGVGRR